jgi:stress-induced-phosphoprotein 1
MRAVALAAALCAFQAADKCIELAPAFVKGYSRKGTLQFFMKEYEKALDTYRTGLSHEPDNEELLEGVQRCVEAIGR